MEGKFAQTRPSYRDCLCFLAWNLLRNRVLEVLVRFHDFGMDLYKKQFSLTHIDRFVRAIISRGRLGPEVVSGDGDCRLPPESFQLFRVPFFLLRPCLLVSSVVPPGNGTYITFPIRTFLHGRLGSSGSFT